MTYYAVNEDVQRAPFDLALKARALLHQRREPFSRLLDVALVLLQAPVALPLISVIYILYSTLNRDKGPFFYQGERLGKHKAPFRIYKIRTLQVEAEKQVGSQLLKQGSGLEIKFGRFLRKTKLDEIPQLWNVLKGDMSILGPRPVRRAVYEVVRKSIEGYDLRFTVKPGLIGYSQVLTPYAAPKRIRALIDNHFIRNPKGPVKDLGFIAYSSVSLCYNVLNELFGTFVQRTIQLVTKGSLTDRRRMSRYKRKDIRLEQTDPFFRQGDKRPMTLVDVNSEGMRIYSDSGWEVGEEIHLLVQAPHKRREGCRRIRCKAIVQRKEAYNGKPGKRWTYLLTYEPASTWNRYKFDQYVLKESVA
ncbi:MAG: sugar transferase [Planctomycetota bacterium]